MEPNWNYMRPTPENLAVVRVPPSKRYAPVPVEARRTASDIATNANRVSGLLAQVTTREGLERAEQLLWSMEQDMNTLRLELESLK